MILTCLHQQHAHLHSVDLMTAISMPARCLLCQEFDRKRKAETKAAETVAAARGECTGGAGPDPLRGGLFDENGRRCTDTAG